VGASLRLAPLQGRMTTINEAINFGIREITEIVERIADQALAGPDVHPPELEAEQPHVESNQWTNGWWLNAKQLPANPGRIGGAIRPWAVVVHTTDMLPRSFAALNDAWQTKKGAGNAAHFNIGRTPSEGVVQLVPITRNANHAGGAGHGWFHTSQRNYHPNLVSVGIELHNAGGLRLVDKQWRWGERVSGKGWMPIGPAFDPADVEIDPVHPLRGWHRFTAWQLEQLDKLLTSLETVLEKMPDGVTCVSAPESAPAWAEVKSARVVGHVDLDAANRSDPWPHGLRWLRERAERPAKAATFEWRGKSREV
jgi:N-acetyl-anhydromuramyl-L-alanine amidase AmpD